ncbi:unnamed protein product [Lactuca virosa]|uniref:Uncharacterized protein n=1 Tax=Lactuca virosa TaxID=75947 RepID=A0AAU9PXB4_9ASTR|nr:unnamed protein product [Lactuca virosa]
MNIPTHFHQLWRLRQFERLIRTNRLLYPYIFAGFDHQLCGVTGKGDMEAPIRILPPSGVTEWFQKFEGWSTLAINVEDKQEHVFFNPWYCTMERETNRMNVV